MNLEQEALEIISEICGAEVSALQPDTELAADLGIDSPKALYMVVEIEDRLQVEIPDDQVQDLKTIGDVLAILREQESSS